MRALVLALLVAGLALSEAGRFRGAPAGDLSGPFEMIAHHKKGDPYGTKTAVYRSAVLPLAVGEVAFTDPATTFLTFPSGPIAISSFRAEVVDEFNASVPLYEVYNHHWIVMKNNGENNLGECNDLPYVFGVGEESRNTFVVYPYPYRLFATGNEKWTANIHIIRTVNVPHVKQCIECHCGDVNNPYNGGGFQCCGDKSVCPTDNNPHPPVKNYYLKYEIDYTEITPDLKPVDVYVFDASNCAVEYNIPPCQDPTSGCVSTISKTYTLQYPTDVLYAVGHVHVGSINITLEADNMQVPICVSRAHYGNGTTPGNENGYVVGLDSCTFNTPIHLPAGTTLRYTANYNSNPYHDSVMALFYMAVAHDENVPPFHRKPMRN